MFTIRQGTFAEAVAISQQIPEFEQPYGVEEYHKRLPKQPYLILIAEQKGDLLGFKVGYERNQDGSFYSWMGGVLPAYRRMKVAKALADAQEAWAKEQGYHSIRFKTRNCHKNMLLFALNNGFYILAVDPKAEIAQYRIWLEKRI